MDGRTASVLLLSILASGPALRAQATQDDPTDVQSRFGVQVKLDLPEKWEASVAYQGRLVGNSSVYRGSYFSGELGRPLGKRLSVFTNYRLATLTGGVAHRFGVGAELEAERGDVTLSFRSLLQHQRKVAEDTEQGTRLVLRTRVEAKVKATRRLAFYGSVEPYFAFSGVYPIDNWRDTAGLEWELLKDLTIDLFYIYRPDYSKIYNRTYHIVGGEISLDLKL